MLRWGLADVKLYQNLSHPEFQIGIVPFLRETIEKGNIAVSVSGFSLLIQRKYFPYIMSYFTPCFMMVLTSWISFSVNYEAVPGKLGLLLTLLLMLINMSNTISQTIPKSDTVCPLILWLFISTLFVIFALFEYFIILIRVKFPGHCRVEAKMTLKAEKSKTDNMMALAMDKAALVLFPVGYSICIAVFCAWLLLKLT